MSVDMHRQRAELARRLAEDTTDKRLEAQLRHLAVEYDAEADAADGDEQASRQE
jgi:hypothetical protein